MGLATKRITVTDPGNGSTVDIESNAIRVWVESYAETDPDLVATLHVDSVQGDGVPLYDKSRIQLPKRAQKLIVQGHGSAVSDIYLFFTTDPCFDMDLCCA